MDAKHFLVITAAILVMLTSCSYSKFKKFKNVEESEFEVEEMQLDESFKEIKTGEMNYTVGIGDEIKITIYGNPEDSTQSTALGEIFGHAVDENGEINVPLLKHVKVAGLTRKEVTAMLEEMYSKYIKNPHVMFDLVKYESKFYYITGSVKNAGKHPIKVNTNILEAVTSIVPNSEDGAIEYIYLKRGETVLPISISELATGSVDFSKYYLKDGDTFYVPAPSANRVYILGEVKKPGAFELNTGNYTMLDLVADAGGLTAPFSSEGRIYMVRQTANKHLLVQLKFDDIFQGKAGTIKLMPGDRVFVSPTVLTSYNRIIQQLLPTFQMLYTGTLIYKNWTK
ncbi:MAG TPA: polysaccharide biosynthesis/export family protein [bacterium]|nr:polysaccharide biosynthesis/export family protein [bacterium]HQN71922.1 polysaccharide biosynthesis/export family protein [bacterium]